MGSNRREHAGIKFGECFFHEFPARTRRMTVGDDKCRHKFGSANDSKANVVPNKRLKFLIGKRLTLTISIVFDPV
jgi:hypothetical protein